MKTTVFVLALLAAGAQAAPLSHASAATRPATIGSRAQPGLPGLAGSGRAFAFRGTRGGAERGRDWHEGSRGANKPNAQADFIACAQGLEAIGISSPRTLTAIGASAGGTLVPGAVLRRPICSRRWSHGSRWST